MCVCVYTHVHTYTFSLIATCTASFKLYSDFIVIYFKLLSNFYFISFLHSPAPITTFTTTNLLACFLLSTYIKLGERGKCYSFVETFQTFSQYFLLWENC